MGVILPFPKADTVQNSQNNSVVPVEPSEYEKAEMAFRMVGSWCHRVQRTQLRSVKYVEEVLRGVNGLICLPVYIVVIIICWVTIKKLFFAKEGEK